ncbi:MAG TPA: tetratricopeptide repeat protein [Pyrinomonadaceae bacterium]|nr:tetratricopeptide repeat protein [Pyrinomonadaceae bacterium]
MLVVPAQGQDNMSVSARPAITVLDSTKEQDGLVGSVRRVKTETARIELKDGRPVEGPTQLVEVTTYGIKGNRIENTSYPVGGGVAGKEEYKYDDRGNITEMTVRDDRGSILSREAYTYEFDKFGNWTKMVTSLVVFENGELKREPVEVSYRTLTYYFDDSIAKIVDEPKPAVERRKGRTAPPLPQPASFAVSEQRVLQVDASMAAALRSSTEVTGEPPPLLMKSKPESVFAARKQAEASTEKFVETRAPERAEPKAEPKIEPKAPPSSQLSPENVAALNLEKAYNLYLTGRSRFDSGDTLGAIDSYLQSLKLESNSAEAHLSLGHAYLKLQKDREAVKAFKDSVKLNPNVAEAHYGLGFVSFRLGRFREAEISFKKATTAEPKMAKAHYGLAIAYQELGNTAGLIDEYRTLERLDKSLAKKLAATFPEFNFSCRLLRGCP